VPVGKKKSQAPPVVPKPLELPIPKKGQHLCDAPLSLLVVDTDRSLAVRTAVATRPGIQRVNVIRFKIFFAPRAAADGIVPWRSHRASPPRANN